MKNKLLKKIKKEDTSYLLELSLKEKEELANEVRDLILNTVAKKGGHLSSNLGIVEISLAALSVYQEEEAIIYDVGHQTYAHKILTGRINEFETIGDLNGLSCFPSRKESKYDTLDGGHAGTAISYMTGLLKAEPEKKLLTIIGDASLQTAIALSSLNFLRAEDKIDSTILVNDNGMSISKSVGTITNKLTENDYSFFKSLGFKCYGPIDGHNISELEAILAKTKAEKGHKIIIVKTIKGYGYKKSEEDKNGLYHKVKPFDLEKGIINDDKTKNPLEEALLKLRSETPFKVITPAMSAGLKIEKFKELYEADFIDTGISEEQSVTLSLGLIHNRQKTILLTYSTFIQRSYDYLINDIARSNTPLIIGLDRIGVIGEEGGTHEGIYDLSMFFGMPNFYIFTPNKTSVLYSMFKMALKINKPVVIRLPSKNDGETKAEDFDLSWELIRNGKNHYVIAYGETYNLVRDVVLKENLKVNLINARTLNPLDEVIVSEIEKQDKKILVIEEVIATNSFKNFLENRIQKQIEHFAIPKDLIIEHGKKEEVRKRLGFNEDNIKRIITNFLNR